MPTVFGNPELGGAGLIIGHGLDRVITRVVNDITGPAWQAIENGPVGDALGSLAEHVGGLEVPNIPGLPFPSISSGESSQNQDQDQEPSQSQIESQL